MTPDDGGPTGREWGDLSRETAEIRHDLRTCRQLVTGLYEETSNLRHEMIQLRTKIHTAISVCAIVASVIGFLVTIVYPMLKGAG